MSILDVLGNGSLSSIIETFAQKASSTASDFRQKTPDGMGGLLGAGAIGALLGNLASSDMLKNASLLGAGAVAWNFYQKWAQSQQARTDRPAAANAPAAIALDATSELVMRAMIYAAKADGNIDATERRRINAVLERLVGDQDVTVILDKIQAENLDPARIAAQIQSLEQAEDIFRLSCMVIDVDHFMERGYLDALANSLGVAERRKTAIEAEASQARKQLAASLA